jgi:hypothetical protein
MRFFPVVLDKLLTSTLIDSTSKASGRLDVEEEKKTCPRFGTMSESHCVWTDSCGPKHGGVYLDGRAIKPFRLVRRTGLALGSAIRPRFIQGSRDAQAQESISKDSSALEGDLTQNKPARAPFCLASRSRAGIWIHQQKKRE